MFENTLKMLEQLNGTMTYTMDVLPDEDGYYDKECPNEKCSSKFKVNAEDWKNLFRDEEAFCPFCGHSAPATSWWTTEQIEQAKKQAFNQVSAKIGQALEKDARDFNRSQPRKSFIKMSMKFSGQTSFINLPVSALEEAKLTFFNTIDKVKAKINNLEVIRNAIEAISKDEAARTCTSLIETSVPDLVVAFQRLCECIYPQIEGAKPLKRNVFQRLDDGNKLWHDLVGKGYDDWITNAQFDKLRICFQQRHLLQHQDGIVDQDYIIKSGDKSYQIGQHLMLKDEDIRKYAEIVETLGKAILALLDEVDINE